MTVDMCRKKCLTLKMKYYGLEVNFNQKCNLKYLVKTAV